jgi:hypothetical protein
MRKFHSIAALRGDGLRPEVKALFDRQAVELRAICSSQWPDPGWPRSSLGDRKADSDNVQKSGLV